MSGTTKMKTKKRAGRRPATTDMAPPRGLPEWFAEISKARWYARAAVAVEHGIDEGAKVESALTKLEEVVEELTKLIDSVR